MMHPANTGPSPGAPTFTVEILESSDGADWTALGEFGPGATPPAVPAPSLRRSRDPSGGGAE